MKNPVLILLLILPALNPVYSQQKTYKADYYGEVNDSTINELFRKESGYLDFARKNEGKITILNKKGWNLRNTDNIAKPASSKTLSDLSAYLGKNDDNTLEKLCTCDISTDQFKAYFNSLDTAQKQDMLYLSKITYDCNIVKNTPQIQDFVLSQYPLVFPEGNKRAYKYNFMAHYNTRNAADSIFYFVKSYRQQDNGIFNDNIIKYLLSKNQYELAISFYEKLIHLSIETLANSNAAKKRAHIYLQNVNYSKGFLLNEFTRERYINISLEAVESNLYHLGGAMELMSYLWYSGLLNEPQKKRILQYCREGIKHSKDYSIKIKSSIQDCANVILADYYGVEYLKNYKSYGHFNDVDSFPEFELRRIVRNKDLAPEEKNYIRSFVNTTFDVSKIDKDFFGATAQNKDFYTDFSYHENAKKNSYDKIESFLIKNNLYTSQTKNNYLEGYLEYCIYSNPDELYNYKRALLDMLSDSVPSIDFDLEPGFVPLDYDAKITEFFQLINAKHNLPYTVVQKLQRIEKEDDYSYEVYIENQDYVYKIALGPSSDWYSINSIINVLNIILERNGISQKIISLDTGDQTVHYIFCDPKLFKLLDDRFNIKNLYE